MTSPAVPRYVEYLRVSTDDQVKSATPENQRNALARLAAMRPAQPAASAAFEDMGVSGAIPLSERQGWRGLEALVARGGVTELRVYDITRLTRNDGLADCDHLVRVMREHNLVIVTADGEVIRAATSMDLLLLVIRAMGAADERTRILRRTLEGKRRKLEAGLPGSGCLPTGVGYSKQSGWSLSPHWTRIFQTMFSMCAEGRPLAAICGQFDADGIAPPKGARWGVSSLRRLLRDPAFKGELHRWHQGKEYVLTIPPMVDVVTWEAAQAGLTSRWHIPLRARYTIYALCRSLATCGGCGGRMVVAPGGAGPAPDGARRPAHTRYFCKVCKGRRHRADRVDAIVWDSIKRTVINAEELLAAAASSAPASPGTQEPEIEEATANLTRIERKRGGLTARWKNDLFTDEEYDRELAALKVQQDHQSQRLAVARSAAEAATRADLERATLASGLDLLRQRIESADPATQREIVEAVVPFGVGEIRLFPDYRIEIRGVLPIVVKDGTGSARRGRTPRSSSPLSWWRPGGPPRGGTGRGALRRRGAGSGSHTPGAPRSGGCRGARRGVGTSRCGRANGTDAPTHSNVSVTAHPHDTMILQFHRVKTTLTC